MPAYGVCRVIARGALIILAPTPASRRRRVSPRTHRALDPTTSYEDASKLGTPPPAGAARQTPIVAGHPSPRTPSASARADLGPRSEDPAVIRRRIVIRDWPAAEMSICAPTPSACAAPASRPATRVPMSPQLRVALTDAVTALRPRFSEDPWTPSHDRRRELSSPGLALLDRDGWFLYDVIGFVAWCQGRW